MMQVESHACSSFILNVLHSLRSNAFSTKISRRLAWARSTGGLSKQESSWASKTPTTSDSWRTSSHAHGFHSIINKTDAIDPAVSTREREMRRGVCAQKLIKRALRASGESQVSAWIERWKSIENRFYDWGFGEFNSLKQKRVFDSSSTVCDCTCRISIYQQVMFCKQTLPVTCSTTGSMELHHSRWQSHHSLRHRIRLNPLFANHQ